MNYKGHLKSGTLLGIIALDRHFSGDLTGFANSGLLSLSAMGLGLIIGSGLPDIDHHKSFLAKKLSVIGWVVSRFFSHRGFTHSLSFIMLLYLSFVFGEKHISDPYLEVYNFFFISLIFAASVHIIMDMFIGNGVKLFMPLYSRKVSVLKIRSGSKKEKTFHKFLFASFFLYFIFKADISREIVLLFINS